VEACLATTAATSFFDPEVITHGNIERCFIDGALNANNPIWKVFAEAQNEFPPTSTDTTDFANRIRCLVSLGTGKPDPKPVEDSIKQVVILLKMLATETENTAREFGEAYMRLAEDSRYFRLNPPYLDDVGLEAADKKNKIADMANEYGRDLDVRVRMSCFARRAGTNRSMSSVWYEDLESFN
jgi:hypothetical protein